MKQNEMFLKSVPPENSVQKKTGKPKICKENKGEHVFEILEQARSWGNMWEMKCKCGKKNWRMTAWQGDHYDIKTKKQCFRWNKCTHK